MSNDQHPEEKPSFFDSQDESKSWPPADQYEIEHGNASNNDAEIDNLLDHSGDDSDFSNPFSSSNGSDDTSSPNLDNDDDYLDQIIDSNEGQSSVSDMNVNDDEADDDYSFASISSAPDAVSLSSDEVDTNKEATNESYDKDFEEDLGFESLVNENEFDDATVTDDANEFSIDEKADLDDDSTDFSVDDLVEDDSDYSVTEEKDDDATLASLGLGAAATSASSDFVDIVDDDDFLDGMSDNSNKPFRAFKKINLAQELAEEEEEEEGGILAGANKNVLIVLAVLLLFLLYFLFNTFMTRNFEPRARQTRRPPKKEKILAKGQEVKTPLWGIATQNSADPEQETRYAKSLIKFTGRENPFAMPQSVIDALKRQADLELLAKQKPDSYKRKAYRATLLGVLTAQNSTIALVNLQEAEFEVIEGTSKQKILQLATKSMDKAKKNTLEMVKGSYIGPWQITKINAPQGAFSDAKITVVLNGTTKVLSMGRAEDLGIFDPAGDFDDLEQTDSEFEADESGF